MTPTLKTSPIALRRKVASLVTPTMNRTIYLGTLRKNEERLADEWRAVHDERALRLFASDAGGLASMIAGLSMDLSAALEALSGFASDAAAGPGGKP